MTKKEEILVLRKNLKELERFEEEEHKREFKEAREKELEGTLRDLDLDEVVGNEELKQGNRVGVKSTEILRDSLSSFDPIVGKETLDAEIEKKPTEPGETLHTKGAKDAVTVRISKDILSGFDPLSEG